MNSFKLLLLKWAAYILRRTNFKYDASKYGSSFIVNTSRRDVENPKNAPKIVYCFWTGSNAITENRKNSLSIARERLGVELCLLRHNDLCSYVMNKEPLHPAYEYLSLNHRSDYLRCYFMHFFGGGYMDIKENYYSWDSAFDKLNSRTDKWIIGYPEVAPTGVPEISGRIGKDLRKNYFRLIGNGGFIVKPQTPFTEEWFKQITSLLDEKLVELRENPGNNDGSNVGYPLKWAAVQGEIFHPLILKYWDKVIHDKSLLLSFKNYK